MNIEIVAAFIAVWNLVVFFIYGLDKRKAKLREKRISERTLILMAVFMGGAGAMLGMSTFRHKTRHLKFRIAIPVSIVLNIVVFILLQRSFL